MSIPLTNEHLFYIYIARLSVGNNFAIYEYTCPFFKANLNFREKGGGRMTIFLKVFKRPSL